MPTVKNPRQTIPPRQPQTTTVVPPVANPGLNPSPTGTGVLASVLQRINDGNSFQYQEGQQGSAFASQGETLQQQTGGQVGQSQQMTSTNQQQTQQQSEQQRLNEAIQQLVNQSSQRQQTGATTTTGGVVDTLGLQDLIRQQYTNVGNVDAGNQSFLTGLVQNGYGGDMGNRVRSVTNQAVSSPNMIGAGPEAYGRVGGAAVANLVNNETAARIQAAQQLAGPTASTNLIGAATPLLQQQSTQQQQSNDVVSAQTQQDQNRGLATDTSTSNINLSNLLSNQESNSSAFNFSDVLQKAMESGTSNANYGQLAAGRVPTGGGGGGMSVLCTACHYHGLISEAELHMELEVVDGNPKKWTKAVLGYRRWALPFAEFAVKHKWFAQLILPLVKAGMNFTQGKSLWITNLFAKPVYYFSRWLGRRYNDNYSIRWHDNIRQKQQIENSSKIVTSI